MEKPDVDLIEGLSPAIAIEQKTAGHNPRSTVGTVTEIYDYLRLLYARVGQSPLPPLRPADHRPDHRPDGRPGGIAAGRHRASSSWPRSSARRRASHDKLLKRLKKDGLCPGADRRRVAWSSMRRPALGRASRTPIEVVVDRLVVKAVDPQPAGGFDRTGARPGRRQRRGRCRRRRAALLQRHGRLHRLRHRLPGVHAGQLFLQLAAGRLPGMRRARVDAPSSTRTSSSPTPACRLREGAVARHGPSAAACISCEFLEALDRPLRHLASTPRSQDLPDRFPGACSCTARARSPSRIIFDRGSHAASASASPSRASCPNLERRYRETDSAAVREDIKRFMTFRPCPECRGAKLNPASRAVTLAGHEHLASCAP
ncbi:MAG: hypothetical protein MZV70_18770 [Desulfobacterales bacterium]|nr:hypothetical protein [Desulfobacterales bacterium]